MLHKEMLRERAKEALRCARLLELNAAERYTKVCLIACIADTDIHINNIGEVLSLSISNPTQLLVGAFYKSELIGLIQPLLENNGEPALPDRN
ncbi:TPA: hypothetical protein ACGVB5_004637 [Vibrio vulnificus]|nr:hypothetical protein [Vibrio vulnificus]HDY7992918.1 hypothetical protein [Vibrio vulnificus]HDY8021155.1 hypothetical protein [Vibrio vulnificus]